MSSFPTIQSAKGRTFSCFPSALCVFLFNDREQLLLLSHPKRNGIWEIVSGAQEPGEDVWTGAMRELREEIGDQAQVVPLGVAHADSFAYDDQVSHMLSLSFVMAYQGGDILPGDDMTGAEFRWWGLDEIDEAGIILYPPAMFSWVRRRAVELFRLWKDNPPDFGDLQQRQDNANLPAREK